MVRVFVRVAVVGRAVSAGGRRAAGTPCAVIRAEAGSAAATCPYAALQPGLDYPLPSGNENLMGTFHAKVHDAGVVGIDAISAEATLQRKVELDRLFHGGGAARGLDLGESFLEISGGHVRL
ncbi:MAG: hypothetical protein ACREMY_12525 [bacterium]